MRAGIDINWIRMINKYALKPDLAIFIDVEPEAAIKRLKPKKSVMENLENQRKVREIYLKLVEKGELTRIDGNRELFEVADEIFSIVMQTLKDKASSER